MPVGLAVIGGEFAGQVVEIGRIMGTSVFVGVELDNAPGVALQKALDARPPRNVIVAGIQGFIPVIADERAKPSRPEADVLVESPEHAATDNKRFALLAYQDDFFSQVQEKLEAGLVCRHVCVGVHPGDSRAKEPFLAEDGPAAMTSNDCLPGILLGLPAPEQRQIHPVVRRAYSVKVNDLVGAEVNPKGLDGA